jgi:sugar transferase (PEP-CTERM system associated)
MLDWDGPATLPATMRLLNILIPTSILGLLASEILLILCCYTAAVYLTFDVAPEIFLLYDGGLVRIAIMLPVFLVSLYFQDLYADVRVKSRILLWQKVCLVLGLAFLLQALLSYASPGWILPRWVMMVGSGLVLLALPTWRVIYSGVLVSAVHAQRVLFLGASRVAQEIAGRFEEKPELGLAPIGFVGEPEANGAVAWSGKLLGPLEEFRSIVEHTNPDRIIVAMSERRRQLPLLALLDLRFSGVRIEEAATAYETAFGRVSVQEIRPSQLIFSSELGPRPNTVRLQSVYSTIIALVGAVLTAPLMAIIAGLVRLTSPGPILHRQLRVGKLGKPFMLYKFRSMYVDAEAKTGAVWAKKRDPRITPIGRLLRPFRLDELPQFFNVLRGEMSIVGPRPERPEFVQTLAEQIPFYHQRHCVKPGITGWAQINHPYSDSLEDAITKLEYDLYYIKNLAPALDAYIIFHTLKVILLARGAQ